MPKKEVIQVNLAAANPNLSPATRFGDLVFVAGQTGRHPITGEVGRDVREQTRYAIERIKMILETAGTSLDNVLTVLTHLTRREDLAAYNEEYAKFFPSNKPARTTVEVDVERPRTPCGDNRHGLHSGVSATRFKVQMFNSSRSDLLTEPVPVVQLACPESIEGFNPPDHVRAPFKTLSDRNVPAVPMVPTVSVVQSKIAVRSGVQNVMRLLNHGYLHVCVFRSITCQSFLQDIELGRKMRSESED